MSESTTIVISRATHKRLSNLKKHPRESFDEVIDKLLDCCVPNRGERIQ